MPATPQDFTLRPDHGPSEYPALVAICRSAVLATHDFLAPEDFAQIQSMLASAYFPAVDLIVADVDGKAVGFVGAAESKAMLAADSRGVPFVIMQGRRGGSAMAAAAVNALATEIE